MHCAIYFLALQAVGSTIILFFRKKNVYALNKNIQGVPWRLGLTKRVWSSRLNRCLGKFKTLTIVLI